jgi:hypothetical protein
MKFSSLSKLSVVTPVISDKRNYLFDSLVSLSALCLLHVSEIQIQVKLHVSVLEY